MPWTNQQKAIAARAAAAAGLDDDHRKLVLRQFERAVHNGRVTSTSPRLNQSDFEAYMAVVERSSGGRVKVAGPDGKGYPAGYWQDKAADDTQRLRYACLGIAEDLERAGHLKPNGEGLRGWIASRVTHQRIKPTGDIADLDRRELSNLLDGLRAYARRTARSDRAAAPGTTAPDSPAPSPGKDAPHARTEN